MTLLFRNTDIHWANSVNGTISHALVRFHNRLRQFLSLRTLIFRVSAVIFNPIQSMITTTSLDFEKKFFHHTLAESATFALG